MITKSTIDNVFETARLEEVIGDFVQLKKSWQNLQFWGNGEFALPFERFRIW